jgi:hypothetical protein
MLQILQGEFVVHKNLFFLYSPSIFYLDHTLRTHNEKGRTNAGAHFLLPIVTHDSGFFNKCGTEGGSRKSVVLDKG